jgi:hypothetical protein
MNGVQIVVFALIIKTGVDKKRVNACIPEGGRNFQHLM